jgi:hypothetical protein
MAVPEPQRPATTMRIHWPWTICVVEARPAADVSKLLYREGCRGRLRVETCLQGANLLLEAIYTGPELLQLGPEGHLLELLLDTPV